jgi:hypothetical protein
VFTSERGAPFTTAGFARMVERAGAAAGRRPGAMDFAREATDMASRAGRAMSVVNAGVGHTS